MTMFRMPIFTWNILVTSILVLIAFPILAAALLVLESDRVLGSHVFDAANGGPILWQHLFWFFGHPEVYIIALPFFGIITEVLPVFSRKPIFGYVGLVGATLLIGALSVAVWAHHMYVTGAVNLPFFSFMTFLIAVPTGVKFFNWIGTMWGGNIAMRTPMLWAVGFLTTFLFGGLTGVVLASPPLDFHLSDTYFVVAHFHYVVFGTVVFAMFAGFYFWWPKFTGRMLDETLGKIHFWLLFIGFHTTFLVQHWLGVEGMPRRYADYLPNEGFTVLNQVSSAGAFLLGASTLVVPVQRLEVAEQPAGQHRRPVGLGPVAGVGDLLPAAAAQLHLASRGSAPSRRPSTCTTRRWRWPSTARSGSRASSTTPRSTPARTPAGSRSWSTGSGARPTTRSFAQEEQAPEPVTRAEGGRRVKVEAWIFGSLVIFFAIVTPVYWLMSKDPTGTAALIMTFLLVLMIAAYLGLVARRIDPRPEDKKLGEIAEGAGELGFFPPQSMWPLFCRPDLRAGRPRSGLRLVADDPRLRVRRPRPDRAGLRVLPRRPRALIVWAVSRPRRLTAVAARRSSRAI